MRFRTVTTAAALAAAAAGAAGAGDEAREAEVVRWTLSYGGDPASGEPARRALLRAAAGEAAGPAAPELAAMQSVENEVERRGLDHDVPTLVAWGPDGAARAARIVPIPLDRWTERARGFRWAPAADRFVAWEPWGADQAPLRFRGKDRVRLRGTQGLLRPGSACTWEFWVRWPDAKASQYVLSDEAWPELAPAEIPTPTKAGFALRRNPRGGGTASLDLTCAVAPDHWWTIESAPLRVTAEWEHVAVVGDGRSVRLYRDGELVAARATAGVTFRPGVTDAFLGVRELAMKNRNAAFDLRAFRVSEGARYDADFVPPQRLARDDATILALDFSPGGGVLRDVTANGRDGLVEGAAWVPAFDAATIRTATAAAGGGRGGAVVVAEAERGAWSSDWTVQDRERHSEGAGVEIHANDEPDAAGHWASVPFVVPETGWWRVHLLGPGAHRLDASGGISPFSWRVDDGAWRPVAAPLPTVCGVAGHAEACLTPLGDVDLAAGEHVFRLRLLARRAYKDRRYSLWLDAVALERVD